MTDDKVTEQIVPELLCRPTLFEELVKEVQKKVVGEIDTIKSILLFKFGQYVANSAPTSYNLFISDQSGVGKDYLTKSVLALFPENTCENRSKITPEALAYWSGTYNESWDGKSLYLEEISQNVLNSETFRVFCSGGGKVSALIKQKVVDFHIKGKPVLFVTSATKNLEADTIRRFASCQLDATGKQTTEICIKQTDDAERGVTEEYNPTITEALRTLARVKVVIPFGKELKEKVISVFGDSLILRTNYQRFLDLVKASAAMHQFQRKITSNGIEATKEDYKIARNVLLKIYGNKLTIPLTKDSKRLLNVIASMGNLEYHTTAEIECKVSFMSKPTLYKYLRQLEEYGFLSTDNKTIIDGRGVEHPSKSYIVKQMEKLILPEDI